MNFWYGSSDRYRMPPVVVQRSFRFIFQRNNTIAQVENVVNMSIDQFNGYKVLFFTSIVHKDTIRL